MSMRKKKLIKESKYFKQHDEIVNTHIPRGLGANKSPHIILKQWYHRIQKNSIVMRAPKEIKNCRNRQIIYEIESWGANVRFNEKNNNYTLNVEGTKNNKVFLLVRYKDVMADPKLSFFTETGGVVDSETNMDRTKGYVLLATIQSEPVLRQHNTMICHDDILIAKKFLRNQTQTSKKDYHYGTTGHIYGFGYGPVYSSNPTTKHTVEKFAKSKLSVSLTNLFFNISKIFSFIYNVFVKNQQ